MALPLRVDGFLSSKNMHEDCESLYLFPSRHYKEESGDKVHSLAVAYLWVVDADTFKHSKQWLLSNIEVQVVIMV